MKVITVANNKGGVGKTMQAYQLICYLASLGHRVLAIDFDSQANLSSSLGVNVQRTLVPEWLIGDVDFSEIVVKAEGQHDFYKNLWVVPSSRHMANLAKLLILSESEVRKNAGRKERLLKLRLAAIKDQFDYIVIDTPPMLGDELIMSLVASNLILIPTQAQDYSIDGLEELMDTFEIIKETENPELNFSIIPSMVNARRKIERQRLQELSQSFQITPVIRNLVDMQESVAMRKPVVLSQKSKGFQDMKTLWESLDLR
jgi:chromosome partitioning protein